jgi:hypothetical protein
MTAVPVSGDVATMSAASATRTAVAATMTAATGTMTAAAAAQVNAAAAEHAAAVDRASPIAAAAVTSADDAATAQVDIGGCLLNMTVQIRRSRAAHIAELAVVGEAMAVVGSLMARQVAGVRKLHTAVLASEKPGITIVKLPRCAWGAPSFIIINLMSINKFTI